MAAMAGFLPGNVLQRGNFKHELITKTLNNPTFYLAPTERYWGIDPALNFHRAIADLPVALDRLEVWAKDNAKIGMADEYDLDSDDIKVVETGDYAKVDFPTMAFARAINWTWGELERYKTAKALNNVVESLDPIDQKLGLLAEYFNKRDHFLALWGYQARGLFGIFTQRGVARQDALFRPYSKGTPLSSRVFVENMTDILYYYADLSGATNLSQLQLKIPPKLDRILAKPYITDTNEEDGIIRDRIRALGVTDIQVHNELKGSYLNQFVVNDAGSGMYDPAFDRIVIKLRTYTPERHFFPRRLFEPFQVKTLKYEQISVSASSGVMIRQPNVFFYYDFSNSEV